MQIIGGALRVKNSVDPEPVYQWWNVEKCNSLTRIKETKSVTMNIFEKFNFLFKSLVKKELSYVFKINMVSAAKNCMEKWIIL